MKHFLCCISAALCIVFFSCSAAAPELYDVRSMILYDFQSGKTEPSVRMAVYVRGTKAVEEGGSLTITLPSAGYTWHIENPSYVYDTENAHTWMGSSDIFPAPGDSFPAGRYRIVYTNAASVKTEADFTLPSLKTPEKSDLSGYKAGHLAVFNKEHVLLGYGVGQGQAALEEIAEKYPGAAFVRTILLGSDGCSAVLREPAFISDSENRENTGLKNGDVSQ